MSAKCSVTLNKVSKTEFKTCFKMSGRKLKKFDLDRSLLVTLLVFTFSVPSLKVNVASNRKEVVFLCLLSLLLWCVD